MKNAPRLPLSPQELPQQRLHAVLKLPERPVAFDILAFDGYPPPGLKLPRKPGSSALIVQCEWAWSPMHGRIAAWYLHRSRTLWVLWLRHHDDNWGTWEWHAVSAVPIRQASDKQAATHLLMDAWTRERSEMSLDRFHWINEASLLSVSQVKEIAREVWG